MTSMSQLLYIKNTRLISTIHIVAKSSLLEYRIYSTANNADINLYSSLILSGQKYCGWSD